MLVLEGVSKRYLYGKRLFGVLDLKIKDGEIVALYGGEGSGKTTLLKVLAGLEEFDGKITIDGKPISAKTDDVVMLFDDGAIFPLKTAYGNLAYPLKIRKTDKKVIDERIKDVSAKFGIDGILTKRGFRLTDDEKQKISIARLFLRPAKLLLVDEPEGGFSDENFASAKREWSKINSTVVYATSDRKRALDADVIVVLVDGTVKQIGNAEELKFNPSTIWSAEVADENYVVEKATLTRDNGRLNLVIHADEEIVVDFTARENEIAEGFENHSLWCGRHSDKDLSDIDDIVLYDANENSVMKRKV